MPACRLERQRLDVDGVFLGELAGLDLHCAGEDDIAGVVLL